MRPITNSRLVILSGRRCVGCCVPKPGLDVDSHEYECAFFRASPSLEAFIVRLSSDLLVVYNNQSSNSVFFLLDTTAFCELMLRRSLGPLSNTRFRRA